MSTGSPYLGFFSRAVIGGEFLQENFFDALRSDVEDAVGLVIGECVIDPTGVGLGITTSEGGDAIQERRATITGDLTCTLGNGKIIKHAGSTAAQVTSIEGSRTIVLSDPDWYTSLPYANADGTTYRVYLAVAAVPIDVGHTDRGGRGYNRWIDVCGVVVNPDSLTNTGTELRFVIDTELNALGIQNWLTSNNEDDDWSYDVVVWRDTDQSGVSIATDDPDVAIVHAKLHKRASDGKWVVDLASQTGTAKYLGQSSPTTTASHYKIAVLGPIITTTNLDSNADYLHVGTIASAVASETESTTGQHVIESVSQALIDLVDVPEKMLTKAWVTAPTYTVNVNDIDFNDDGEAYGLGQVISTVTEAGVGPFGVSATVFVYYNLNTSAYGFSTLWDTANAVGCVPLMIVATDGAQAITATIPLPRRMKTFNESLVLTVSQTTAHAAQFTTLNEALAHAVGMKASAGTAMRGVVIELIGDVAQAAKISTVSLLNLENVTFRGRGGGPGQLASLGIAGARITWSYDGPLFEIGAAAMRNWRFENITFRYTGTATSAKHSVVTNLLGDVYGLSMYRCTVDGNDVLAGVGGGNGYLPHVVYGENAGSTMADISLVECQLFSAEAVFYQAANADGAIRLTVKDCVVKNDSGAMTFSQGGFIVDLATSTIQSSWRITGNECTALLGWGINSYKLKDSRICDNRIELTGNFSAIKLGNTTTDDDVERVWIRDNQLVVASGGANPILFVITQDASATVPAVLFIHDNYIDGTTGPAGSVGLAINDGTNGASTSKMQVHDNVVVNVETGIATFDASGLLHSNSVLAGVLGIQTGAKVVANNNVSVISASAVGIKFQDTGANPGVVASNYVNMAVVPSGTPIGIDVNEGTMVVATNMIIGNIIGSGIDLNGNIGVAVGNLIHTMKFTSAANLDNWIIASNNVHAMNFDMTAFDLAGSVVSGNRFNGDVTIDDLTDVIWANNVMDSTTFYADTVHRTVVSGCINSGLTRFDQITNSVIGGSVLTGGVQIDTNMANGVLAGSVLSEFIDTGASTRISVSANAFLASGGTHTWHFTDGAAVGNQLLQDFVLDAVTADVAFTGNRVAGTITDNGTGNTRAGNDT